MYIIYINIINTIFSHFPHPGLSHFSQPRHLIPGQSGPRDKATEQCPGSASPWCRWRAQQVAREVLKVNR